MRLINEPLSVIISSDIISQSVTEKKIQEFTKLEEGWHYGEGVSFEPSVLNSAISLIHEARQLALYETDVFPGLNGEVMVTVYYLDYYLEFTIEPNETVTFYQEMDREEIAYQEGLSMQDAIARLKEFRKTLWRESVSSIENITMTIGGEDSTAFLLRTPEEMTQGFPLLAVSASTILPELSANILESIIQRLNPQFSGASQQTYYQPVSG